MNAKLMVFDTNGMPSEKWHHFDPLIAELLHNARDVRDENGDRDKFWAFAHRERWNQRLPGILFIRLDGGDLLNTSDLLRVLNRSIQQCLAESVTDGTKARQRLQRLCAASVDAMAKSTKAYVVVSRLSLPPKQREAIEVVYGGVEIRVCDTPSSLPPLPECLLQARSKKYLDLWQECRYPIVVSRVMTFSPFQAMDRVAHVFELVRAVATLHAIHGTRRVQIIGTRSKPFAEMLIGPMHLVSEDGLQSFVNDYCYEDRYWHISPALSDEEKWLAVRPAVIETLRQLDGRPYRRDAENLWIRYGAAMNETRWSMAALGLWAVLEHITGTVGRDQPKMARWATRLPESNPQAARLIAFARCTRNRIVHAGHQSEINEQWAEMLRPIVEQHLLRLANQYCGIQSLDEYRQLLRLPESVVDTEREMALRKAVMAEIQPKPSAAP